MSRIFITGSADGLGLLAGQRLIEAGHEVTLHARSSARAADARAAAPDAADILTGDLSSLAQTRALAERANVTGRFDAVIHNAGIYIAHERTETEDGLPTTVQINVLAPYLLTALMPAPDRLVYLTSGLADGGEADLTDLAWTRRRWSGSQAYADSKLLDATLAFAVARRWPQTFSNAVDPGWVPTKMGGEGAPGDVELGAETQVWLASSDDPSTRVSGTFFHHRRAGSTNPAASDPDFQDAFLEACAELTGVTLP